MATESELKQWEVNSRLTFDTTVTIEAATAEEAEGKFGALDWVSDGMAGSELINWDQLGAPKEAK